jgi:hypothetical protein
MQRDAVAARVATTRPSSVGHTSRTLGISEACYPRTSTRRRRSAVRSRATTCGRFNNIADTWVGWAALGLRGRVALPGDPAFPPLAPSWPAPTRSRLPVCAQYRTSAPGPRFGPVQCETFVGGGRAADRAPLRAQRAHRSVGPDLPPTRAYRADRANGRPRGTAGSGGPGPCHETGEPLACGPRPRRVVVRLFLVNELCASGRADEEGTRGCRGSRSEPSSAGAAPPGVPLEHVDD